MHCHLQTKGRCLRTRFLLPPLESWYCQIRFRCRRMSLGGHHRFGSPLPRRVRKLRSPHRWRLPPRRTRGCLRRCPHRQRYHCLHGVCASRRHYGYFTSQWYHRRILDPKHIKYIVSGAAGPVLSHRLWKYGLNMVLQVVVATGPRQHYI